MAMSEFRWLNVLTKIANKIATYRKPSWSNDTGRSVGRFLIYFDLSMTAFKLFNLSNNCSMQPYTT